MTRWILPLALGALLPLAIGASLSGAQRAAEAGSSWRVTLYAADGAVLRAWDTRTAPEVDGRCVRWPEGAACGGVVTVERRAAP